MTNNHHMQITTSIEKPPFSLACSRGLKKHACYRGALTLSFVLIAGCSSYNLPNNVPRAELHGTINGLSGRHYGGQIQVAVPECGDKAWWPKELFSNQGYSGATRPQRPVAVEAGRPIVLLYSHSYPVSTYANAVCGGTLIVTLTEGGVYEAIASMTPKLEVERGATPAFCSFKLTDKRTGSSVVPTVLQCGANTQ